MAFAPTTRHLLRAKDLADARYFEPLGVDDMAAAAGLSRAHFSREFRRAFGDAALGAGGGAAPKHGPLGHRHLPVGGASEPWIVHDELHAHLRGLPHRVPR